VLRWKNKIILLREPNILRREHQKIRRNENQKVLLKGHTQNLNGESKKFEENITAVFEWKFKKRNIFLRKAQIETFFLKNNQDDKIWCVPKWIPLLCTITFFEMLFVSHWSKRSSTMRTTPNGPRSVGLVYLQRQRERNIMFLMKNWSLLLRMKNKHTLFCNGRDERNLNLDFQFFSLRNRSKTYYDSPPTHIKTGLSEINSAWESYCLLVLTPR